jgi:hypothetical protein
MPPRLKPFQTAPRQRAHEQASANECGNVKTGHHPFSFTHSRSPCKKSRRLQPRIDTFANPSGLIYGTNAQRFSVE